ncbi:VOC family protein [Nocardioides euryhalodurans]|nr:VOC family protein [Nocardioides euryhalodurans]
MTVSVRYIVDDARVAAAFYRDHLGFRVRMEAGAGFAMLDRDDLRLLLNAPGAGGAGQGDGRRPPEPGGWNRIQLEVDDVAAARARLAEAGVELRSPVLHGNAGSQVLVADPSGNLVELFERATT